MMKRIFTCDVCDKEVKSISGTFAITLERRRAPMKRRAVRAMRGRRRYRCDGGFREVDVCKACAAKPLTIATLIKASKHAEELE